MGATSRAQSDNAQGTAEEQNRADHQTICQERKTGEFPSALMQRGTSFTAIDKKAPEK